ncbi:MAG: squalene--hopene cyclase [Cyanobacteria bacterium QS_8_64_29]|nr:MAG: squalene--hopene cyclase [Cyanobacteria bacterium QS_8_64_29]
MQAPSSVTAAALFSAIAAGQEYLLGLQAPAGYWQSELESNVTITAEIVLLHKIWGTEGDRPLDKAAAYLRQQQLDNGGWSLFYGDGGHLSTAIEAYMALRLLGVPASDAALGRARDFILARGGISSARIFTKLHLALIGCYDWRGVPSIPPWLMLLPEQSPFTIYELSSWARASTVPLIVVCDRKPVFATDPAIKLDELYAEGRDRVRFELPKRGDWRDGFVWLDDAFKAAEDWNLVPGREEGVRAAERWILAHQDPSGNWGGIIPAMLNSLLALRCLDYDVADPVVRRGLQAVDRFAIETPQHYRVQACISPVWDTAWALRALRDSGLEAERPELVRAGDWLLAQQILDYGDWAVKNPRGEPGGWAFEFDNRHYPDLDDTAAVVMALQRVRLPDERHKRAAMERAVRWLASMQCQQGGWGAFDVDNNQAWLNELPYGDLQALIDPNTTDVTARVLEMLGHCNLAMHPDRVQRAIAYLSGQQESNGAWYGRWGVNYIYGTSGALSALCETAPQSQQRVIARGAAWLAGCQNSDGGWGETCRSYDDPTLRGQGNSTASQTAWALIGLIAAERTVGGLAREAIERGAGYLLATQQADGSWDEAEFTGTGFPGHFYIRYRLYPQYFPLKALGDYRAWAGASPPAG